MFIMGLIFNRKRGKISQNIEKDEAKKAFEDLCEELNREKVVLHPGGDVSINPLELLNQFVVLGESKEEFVETLFKLNNSVSLEETTDEYIRISIPDFGKRSAEEKIDFMDCHYICC